MNELMFNEDDLIENPTPRVPIVLCLDTSASMSGAPIKELSEGVNLFYKSIYDDEVARYSAEICIVTFGNGGIQKNADFDTVDESPNMSFSAGGVTPMGGAVSDALDLLEYRKQQYKTRGVDYFQPWLVLMTDGAPTDSIDKAVKRTVKLESQKRLAVFLIGIGSNADMEVLAKFTANPKRPPLRLRGLEFQKFFEWLSASVQKVSASTPGQEVKLDLEGIKGWGEL